MRGNNAMENKGNKKVIVIVATVILVVALGVTLFIVFGKNSGGKKDNLPVGGTEREEMVNTTPIPSTETPETETESQTTESESETPSSETETTTEEDTATEATYTYTDLNKTMYAKSTVNVRNLPSTDGAKLGSLNKGDEVTVTGKCNETGWYRISFGDSVAYVSNSYLSETKPAEDTSSNTPSSGGTQTPNTGNTTTSSHIVEQLYTNASVGDGLDSYRNGLHMWTDDGKTQLYVYAEYDGKIGYFFCNEDNISAFNTVFQEVYIPERMYPIWYGSSTIYDTGVYEQINGIWYEYQFKYFYTYDENGNKVY